VRGSSYCGEQKSGCRWKDCLAEYGPHTTVHNRFTQWAERGVWEGLCWAFAELGRSTEIQMIDSTHVKAHRSASGGKGEQKQGLAAHKAPLMIRRSSTRSFPRTSVGKCGSLRAHCSSLSQNKLLRIFRAPRQHGITKRFFT
jgi:hypothetical protein